MIQKPNKNNKEIIISKLLLNKLSSFTQNHQLNK